MALWDQLFKLFTYAYTPDPLSKKSSTKNITGAGVPQPDAIIDLRYAADLASGEGGYIRVQNELVDLTQTTNRTNRYKEYERLLISVAEIDMAMTVFADEACVAEDTLISTVYNGPKTIKWLSENYARERFPVYCYDFEKRDYTIGWAYDPRFVKRAETVRVVLDNGDTEIVTPDHLILTRDGRFVPAGELKWNDELMPFYKVKANQNLTKVKYNQFPRMFSFRKGWLHERQFIDEWRTGKDLDEYKKLNTISQLITGNLTARQILKAANLPDWRTVTTCLQRNGFSFKEIKFLSKRNPDRRRVIGVHPHKEIDVYDLSVEKHKNFCTNSIIMHNCQKDEEGRVFKIECANKEVQEECEFLFFHRDMLNFDQRTMWDKAKRLFVKGDEFWEIVIDPDDPKTGILKIQDLPPETMYRIETTRSKLLEFQQGKEGPDFQAIQRAPVHTATEQELQQATAIRFAPEQIIHLRIGDYRKSFYPYGVSLIEPARGPAHQLRMMEDAMVVYRLCLVGDTRIRTEDGYKYIKDLEAGERVYTFTPHGLEKSTVLELIDNDVQEVYKVRSKHVEITGTKTHPILVNREGVVQYVDIQDLIPKKDKLILITQDDGKEIPIPRTIGEPWAKLNDKGLKEFRNNKYKNKSELLRKCNNFDRAKQFLYCKNKALPLEDANNICDIFGLDKRNLLIVDKGQNKSERIDLPRYVNEDFARLFGFICGDGNIHNWNQLSFSTSEDEQINTYYTNLLKTFFKKVRFERDKRSAKGLGKYIVDSTFVCKLFKEMGYIHNHKSTRIPDWVFKAKKNIRRAFIEGLSDADGCERHTKAGTWFSTIELSNKKLIEDIKELWASIGLCSGHIKPRLRNTEHEIEPGRKIKGGWSYSVTISDKLLPKFENVLEVRYAGEERVYDISVDHECHNFIANTIPVHNTRAPERRVFYVDIGQLPPFKAEAFIERMKDQFRKKKVVNNLNRQTGPNAVEERWHAPAQDEDYWLPIRPNSNTRIETLPGAQNLGEIDDAVYFRNKLFTALNFPKNYFSLEDPNATRITLSAQDVKFARYIERLQSHIEEALYQLANRHLQLRGFTPESYEDLMIKMTPPSDWRELSRAEISTNRINNANSLKGSQLIADFDILTKWMKYTPEEANEMISRMKIQKLEDLKLQVLAQNPQLLGVGIPGQGEQEIGTEPGGPSPMLGAEGMPPPGPGGMPGAEGMPPPGPGGMPGAEGMPPPGLGGMPGAEGMPPEGAVPMPPEQAGMEQPAMAPPKGQAPSLPNPTDEDIVKYDLEIQDFEAEMDVESPDYGEVEEK